MVLAQTDAQDSLYGPVANMQGMGVQSLALAGGSQPHNNLQPYLTLSFCIALQGIFPPRG
jgi:microcystin-dependent protein